MATPQSPNSTQRLLCICARVSEGDVHHAIACGASSVHELKSQTGAGGGCRACLCRMERLLVGLPACTWNLFACRQCGCSSTECDCAST